MRSPRHAEHSGPLRATRAGGEQDEAGARSGMGQVSRETSSLRVAVASPVFGGSKRWPEAQRVVTQIARTRPAVFKSCARISLGRREGAPIQLPAVIPQPTPHIVSQTVLGLRDQGGSVRWAHPGVISVQPAVDAAMKQELVTRTLASQVSVSVAAKRPRLGPQLEAE